jgi:hypothetical protein
MTERRLLKRMAPRVCPPVRSPTADAKAKRRPADAFEGAFFQGSAQRVSKSYNLSRFRDMPSSERIEYRRANGRTATACVCYNQITIFCLPHKQDYSFARRAAIKGSTVALKTGGISIPCSRAVASAVRISDTRSADSLRYSSPCAVDRNSGAGRGNSCRFPMLSGATKWAKPARASAAAISNSTARLRSSFEADLRRPREHYRLHQPPKQGLGA